MMMLALLLLPILPIVTILLLCGHCWLCTENDAPSRAKAAEEVSWWGRIMLFYGILDVLFYSRLL